MLQSEKRISVPAEAVGSRLDVWLSHCFEDMSRSRIQGLIKAGDVLVDGVPGKANRKLVAGMEVFIRIPCASVSGEPEAEDIPVDFLYRDDDIAVVNKSPGMVMHPAAGHAHGTLVNALLHHCGELPGIAGRKRPGIVHRLDKDTSGVLIVALTDRAMASLQRQFKRRAVDKQYLALVWGSPSPRSGRIDTAFGRNPTNRKKMSARVKIGRQAITDYEVETSFGRISLLRIRLLTGRTHQIRVHLSHRGWPIVGDSEYGRRNTAALGVPVGRQMLHSERLSIQHPTTRERVEFTAPLPDDMRLLIESLRKQEDNDK